MNKHRGKNRCGTWLVQAFLLPVFLVLGIQSQSFAQTTNLALGKPASESSVEGDNTTTYGGAKAVDGSLTTRWSSKFIDPQWIAVDLNVTYNLSRVTLKWETAYASQYRIQVSSDGSNWTTVYTQLYGTGGTESITLSTGVSGRYVRLYCIKRKTAWGDSLWEFEVYGTPAVSDKSNPTAPTGILATGISTSQVDVTWSPSTDQESGVAGYNIFRNGIQVNPTNALVTTTRYTDSGLAAAKTFNYTVEAVNGVGLKTKQPTEVPGATFSADDPVDWTSLTQGKTKYTAYTAADLLTFAQNNPVPAGSVVVIKNNPTSAAYDWGTITLKTNNVIFTAETSGKVTFTGGGYFDIVGNDNVFGGFVFDGMKKPIQISNANPSSATSKMNTSDTGGLRNRITNNIFKRCGDVTNMSVPFLEVRHRSHDNRIDHNVFDSNWSPMRITLDDVVSGVNYSLDAYGGPSKNLRIDHNTFQRTLSVTPTAAMSVFNTGPGEDTNHGTSALNTQAVFEFNKLTGVIGDGNGQIVQNKTSANTYRYNSFTDVKGALILRDGDRVEVYGNYFAGASVPTANIDGAGAIKMSGAYHRIYNNIFSVLQDNCVICVQMWGTKNDGNHNTDTHDNLIANNTILNFAATDSHGNWGWGIAVGARDNGAPYAPTNTTVVNNIVMSSATAVSAEAGLLYESTQAYGANSNSFLNNMIYSSTVPLSRGFTWSDSTSLVSGNKNNNPAIVTYNVLPSSSLAKDIGYVGSLVRGINVDYNRKIRVYGTAPDIGAVEYQP